MKIVSRTTSAVVVLITIALFCAAQQPAPAGAQQSSPAVIANNIQLTVEGKVINVHDGDTVTVLDQDNRKFHIRLHGIDAPELKQAFGTVSQQNLSRMVLGKQVTIFWTKIDKYRRTVGTISLDGRDINIEQIKAGLAWHFKKYEAEQEPLDRRTYAAAEQQARAARLGLWQEANPTAPGDWRQEVKAKRWGPPPTPGTIIGNQNSRRYHRPDCSGYRDMAESNRVFFKSVEEAEAAGFKRAGNCPAEEQILLSKPVGSASTIESTTANVSHPTSTVSSTAEPPVLALPNPGPEPLQSQPSETPFPEGISDGKIIGNRNSKVYHLPGCSSYNKVSEKDQIKFSSTVEAEQAGYKLAGDCSPNQSARQ